MNDLYFQYDHQPDEGDLVDLAAAIADVFTETWAPFLPDTWIGRSVFAFDMTVSDGANAVNDSIRDLLGSLGGTALPNNATLAIARKNGLRGRSGNGRIFWMGLSTAAMADENSVGAPFATDVVTAVEATNTAAADLGGTGCILSFQHDGVVSSAATIYPIAFWTLTDRTVDSRRKRLPGRGV